MPAAAWRTKIGSMDLKLIFEDGDWVLMRPSGTEPVVRIYTEAASVEASEKLADQARAWITR